MAKMNKGILGPITGKLGSIVGSSWKGLPYLKMESKVSKKRVPSAAQQLHHQKFSFLTKWLKPLHPFVQMGYQNHAQRTTEINAAFSYNFKTALKVDENTLYIDYESVRLSRGRLHGLFQFELSRGENTLQLNWKNKNGCLSAYNDQLMLVLYNDEIAFADGFIGGVKRSAKAHTFSIEKKLVGKYFHVFVSLVGANGKEISESQYLGRVEPL